MHDRLRRLLAEFSSPAGTMGGRAVDREALRTALEGIVRNLRTMLWTAVCMVLLVFLIEVGISLAFIRDQKILAGMGGAMGLTVAGAIETVRRIARDLAQSNLLVVLSGELDTDALKPVIAALARKI